MHVDEDEMPTSRFILLGGKKAICRGSGPDWRAGAVVRGCGPHCPPVPRKDLARDEASEATRAGRGNAIFESNQTGGYGQVNKPSARNSKGAGGPFIEHLDRP